MSVDLSISLASKSVVAGAAGATAPSSTLAVDRRLPPPSTVKLLIISVNPVYQNKTTNALIQRKLRQIEI